MDQRLLDEFARICGAGAVLHEPLQLMTYECDALPHLRRVPAAVVLPSSTSEVQAIVRVCHREGVPFVARGHGTGLSGGAMPVAGGIVIALTRLNRILEVDIPNRRVTVGPGVTNLDITKAVAPSGYYYAPDPSSQQVCSIGGNVAENSGGAHCLKYGFTTHHVLALEVVLPDGELVHIGSPLVDTPGPDLIGLFVGSEGTLGIATKIVVRILRRPESVQTLLAAFDSIDEGGAAVSAIIGEGIIPAAVEMMDKWAIKAAEAAVHPNFPPRRHDSDRRARRPGRRGPIALWDRRRDVPEARRDTDRDCAGRAAARAHLAGTQIGIRRRRPDLAELLRAGRRRAAHEIAGSAGKNQGALRAVGAADRQRVSRGRRQPASADLLRRERPGRDGSRRRRGGRDPRRTAWRPEDRSPASTASAPTRRSTCRACSRTTTSM